MRRLDDLQSIDGEEPEVGGPLDTFRRFFALRGDVLVLSLATFAFSLGFQMTNRFALDYLVFLGATGFVVGLFGTFNSAIQALYRYTAGCSLTASPRGTR